MGRPEKIAKIWSFIFLIFGIVFRCLYISGLSYGNHGPIIDAIIRARNEGIASKDYWKVILPATYGGWGLGFISSFGVISTLISIIYTLLGKDKKIKTKMWGVSSLVTFQLTITTVITLTIIYTFIDIAKYDTTAIVISLVIHFIALILTIPSSFRLYRFLRYTL